MALLAPLKRSYLTYLGKPKTIHECVNTYNTLKSKQYLPIRDEFQLIEMVKQFFSEAVASWIQTEGRSIIAKCLDPRQTAEKELQRVLGLHLKNIAFERKLRPNELTTLKEPETLDGKKTDFLIHYGLMRPVVVEIKLSDHADIKAKRGLESKESFTSYRGYLKKYNAAGGLFVVLDVGKRRGNETWDSQLARIRSAYESVKENSYVIGIALAAN